MAEDLTPGETEVFDLNQQLISASNDQIAQEIDGPVVEDESSIETTPGSQNSAGIEPDENEENSSNSIESISSIAAESEHQIVETEGENQSEIAKVQVEPTSNTEAESKPLHLSLTESIQKAEPPKILNIGLLG